MDLNRYLAQFFGSLGPNPTQAELDGALVIMNYSLWVYRERPGFTGKVPNPAFNVANTDPAIYGWPRKTTDKSSAFVPFLSDACFSGYGTSGDMQSVDSINISGANNSPALIQAKKTSGHVSANSRGTISVNSAFTDGHVASNKRQQLKCVYIGDASTGWFY